MGLSGIVLSYSVCVGWHGLDAVGLLGATDLHRVHHLITRRGAAWDPGIRPATCGPGFPKGTSGNLSQIADIRLSTVYGALALGQPQVTCVHEGERLSPISTKNTVPAAGLGQRPRSLKAETSGYAAGIDAGALRRIGHHEPGGRAGMPDLDRHEGG